MNEIPTPSETSFSYTGLFGREISGLVIDRIEIPLIQRDYAQGRQGEVVERIRANFLDALCAAIMPDNKAIGLDFVYGDVENSAFYPLDGQQRLTTLFLLHWYLAWRAGVPIQNQPWTKFTYATRSGARRFCERLAEFQPPADEIVGDKKLSAWLTDQAWYLYTWQYDPTIQSMLVMLDALHHRFYDLRAVDCTAAWHRLTNAQQPAISFHLLPMTANGLTDDLYYIKMNSRGKPLTAFENFKAHFEALLNTAHTDKADDFAKKVDTDWANILWEYRGDDNLIDDEFMRYFRFITEVCAWQCSVSLEDKPRTGDLAEQIYGANNAKAPDHLEFLFKALDVWHQKNIKAEFESLLTATPGGASTPLILFNAFHRLPKDESPVDLFAACCRFYGKSEWTLAHTLLLHAVLLNRVNNTANFPRQLRIIRNLIEASSGGEIRDEKMPELLAFVKRIVVDNTLQGVTAFNQTQITNENDKGELLVKHQVLQATLYRLEDHNLLRGCLAAFELDPSIIPNIFIKRADAFHALFDNPVCWSELTGALLAIGDYSRKENRWTGYSFAHFGVSKNEAPWRNLLADKKMPNLITALMNLLDHVAAANNNLVCLQTIQQNYLQQCATKKEMDWRYYFVKYPAMREGSSGRYTISPSGYDVCMLNNPSMRGYYRDPYLLAIWHVSGVGKAVADPWPWFDGYETESRRMVLKNSGIRIQCVDKGWQITEAPTDPTQKATFDQVCLKHGIGQNGLYTVPQNKHIDTSDRVDLGAKYLRDLVNAGL